MQVEETEGSWMAMAEILLLYLRVKDMLALPLPMTVSEMPNGHE